MFFKTACILSPNKSRLLCMASTAAVVNSVFVIFLVWDCTAVVG